MRRGSLVCPGESLQTSPWSRSQSAERGGGLLSATWTNLTAFPPVPSPSSLTHVSLPATVLQGSSPGSLFDGWQRSSALGQEVPVRHLPHRLLRASSRMNVTRTSRVARRKGQTWAPLQEPHRCRAALARCVETTLQAYEKGKKQLTEDSHSAPGSRGIAIQEGERFLNEMPNDKEHEKKNYRRWEGTVQTWG